MGPPSSNILLDNRRQARKVRWLYWGTVMAAALALWGAAGLLQSYGLSPGDGGVLRPLWQRALLAALVGGAGVALAAGMLLYLSLYALRIERSGERVTITTMTPLGRRRDRVFASSELGASGRLHGEQTVLLGGVSVHAPWLTLRAKGRRLPFIVDLKAETVDAAALTALGVRAGRKR